MELKRLIAKRIKVARVEREINQSQLSDLLGVNQQYVAKLESGRVDLRVETLERIARALNKPITYFFQPFEDEIIKPSPNVVHEQPSLTDRERITGHKAAVVRHPKK